MKSTEKPTDQPFLARGATENELKRNSFSTPKAYFEDLTPRIMERVHASSVIEEPSRMRWQNLLIPTIGFACLLIVSIFMIRKNTSTEPDFNTVLASLSVAELTEYADLEPAELVSYELVNYSEPNVETSNLSEADVIDYLSSEDDFELNTVIEEIEL